MEHQLGIVTRYEELAVNPEGKFKMAKIQPQVHISNSICAWSYWTKCGFRATYFWASTCH
jgi:hypothetical protein